MTKIVDNNIICNNLNIPEYNSDVCRLANNGRSRQKKLFPTTQYLDPEALSRKKAKGLSNVTHLTARLTVRMRQNGEGQVFISERNDHKNPKPPNPEGRKKGEIVQSGLTSRGKRTIRVISDCYQQLVLNIDGFYDRNELKDNLYNKYCRFITLTFRNLIPTDQEAKRLLDNFFKRLARKTGRKIHYLWVAERQKRGAIHFHILTPEKVVDDTNLNSKETRLQENMWINRTWNEIVCNWAYSRNKITKTERDIWLSEYSLSEGYYRSLCKYRNGEIKHKPKRPSKSKFLLLPNCVHVNSAGNYMAKYISKEDQNIIGGMYGASTSSRTFMEARDVVQKDIPCIVSGNEMIRYMYGRAKASKIFVCVNELEHNESLMIWCKDGWKLMEWYYEFLELQSLKKMKVVTGSNRFVTV